MDITPVLTETRQLVRRYGSGSFTIAGRDYRTSVIVFPDTTLSWPVTCFAEITEATLAPVTGRADAVEVLLLGCGAAQEFLTPALRDTFRRQGIAVDCMDTGAACRTLNILLAEDRRVAAALLVV